MTDWDLMVEYIRQAMEALDKAHEASSELSENTTAETLDQFREKLGELTEELTELQTVLEHQEAFALDEMADWLSQAFRGTPSEYRRTPRMRI
jgi:Zn-dependent oligopeptidase